jgi:hypothetical protein
MNDVQTAWDDLDTLVFDRDDVSKALARAAEALRDDTVVMMGLPSLIEIDDDAEWLASLPAPVRAVLERARRPVSPRSPRIPGAIAVAC